jgi:hypothetical protein
LAWVQKLDLPTYPHHKHLSDGSVVACDPPGIEQVLQEIAFTRRLV